MFAPNVGARSGDADLILGDNNTAFVTDGAHVAAFTTNGLFQLWNYTTNGGTLSLIAASPNGGATINDTEQGVIQLNSYGYGSPEGLDLQGAMPYAMLVPAYSTLDPSLGLWAAASPSAALSFVVGPTLPIASEIYAEPAAGPEAQRSAITVPSSLSYDLGARKDFDGYEDLWCGGKLVVGYATQGYMYCAAVRPLDKNRQTINNQHLRIWETIQVVASTLPPTFPLATSQGRGVAPDSSGTFIDHVGLIQPDTNPPLQAGNFLKVKQFLTLTNKLKSYNNLRINCHNLQWNFDTVTDVTRTPNASCQ
ncbi:MAG: hypothetical protein ACRD40_11990 [Candidatus Acidiferrales bacterium]